MPDLSSETQPSQKCKQIHLQPRYYRLHTEQGTTMAEANYRHAQLDWHAPISDFALVLIDVWNGHYSAETHERGEQITAQCIAPTVAACRDAGLLVIHGPAAPVAQRHPNWVNLCPDAKTFPAQLPDSPTWPPADFVQKQGQYAKYARPSEPQAALHEQNRLTKRDFHPLVQPQNDEPVILNGEELHRVCAQRGIVHLIFAGFNTNACLLMRDYGILAMQGRGYGTLLLTDCTTAMETHETQPQMTCTQGTIASLEQFGTYTLTSKQLIASLTAATPA